MVGHLWENGKVFLHGLCCGSLSQLLSDIYVMVLYNLPLILNEYQGKTIFIPKKNMHVCVKLVERTYQRLSETKFTI